MRGALCKEDEDEDDVDDEEEWWLLGPCDVESEPSRGASTGMDVPVGRGCTAGATEGFDVGVPRDDEEDEMLSLWVGGLRRKSRSTSFSPRLGNVQSAAVDGPADRQASHGAWHSGPWTHLVRNLLHRRHATVPRRRAGGGVLPSAPGVVGVTGDWRGGDGKGLATRMLPPISGDESRSSRPTAILSVPFVWLFLFEEGGELQ